jgi:hypothetical protein
MLLRLIPNDHPFLNVISWITGVQQGGGVGGFFMTLIQGHGGQGDVRCSARSLTLMSRAGGFKDIVFFVEMYSVTVV